MLEYRFSLVHRFIAYFVDRNNYVLLNINETLNNNNRSNR